jgi:hypothetical protein
MQVLLHDLGDPEIAEAFARRLDRRARRLFSRFAAGGDDLDYLVDTLCHDNLPGVRPVDC